MRKARKRKGGVFKVRVCRHCGRKTRGPAHFRHEQACRPESRGKRRRRLMSRRQSGVRRTSTNLTWGLLEPLRRLVQKEIQRQLGIAP